MIYQLGIGVSDVTPSDLQAAMVPVDTPADREAGYLQIQRSELRTIQAINMGRAAMRRDGVSRDAIADLSRRVTELETNKTALRRARELILTTASEEGDAWVSGPIPPLSVSDLGNPLAVIPIGVMYLLAGAIVVGSVAVLLGQMGGVQAFVDAQEDAFAAFNECIDQEGGARCDQILKLAAQTGGEITKVRKAEETKGLTIAIVVGIAVILGGAIYFGRRKG